MNIYGRVLLAEKAATVLYLKNLPRISANLFSNFKCFFPPIISANLVYTFLPRPGRRQ